MFCAFVQMFYYILYTDLDEFATFNTAFQTCFTMLLGRFKFGSLKETSMTVGDNILMCKPTWLDRNITPVRDKIFFFFYVTLIILEMPFE